MDFVILWIFCLLSFLLTVSFFLGLAAGFEKKLWRYLVFGLPAGIIFIFLSGVTLLLGFVRANNVQPLWLFPYALSLTLFYIIGIILMFRWGMKRPLAGPPTARWPKTRLAFLSGLMICLTLGIYLHMDYKMLFKLSKIRAASAIRAQNLLTPRLPDHLNAAGWYERAGEEMDVKRGEKYPDWFSSVEPAAFKPLSQEAHKLMAQYQPTLSLARKASALPGYYIEMDPADLISTPMPNYLKIRDISKLLVLSAQQKVLNGDTAGALAELKIIEEMTRHIRNTPTIFAVMIAGLMDQLCSAGMEYVLAHAETIPAALSADPTVSLGGIPPFIHRSFEMESLLEFQVMSDLDLSVENDPFSGNDYRVILLKLLRIRFWRVFFAEAEMAWLRKYWEDMRERIDTPPEKQETGWQDWKKKREAEPKGLLAFILIPDFSQYVIKAQIYMAMGRLTNMALAAAAFHRDTGRYPARPEELVPAYLETVPLDPFDGTPLKLKPVTGGVDLFCVGPDMKDVVEKSPLLGPIHFYLGREAYEKYRLASIAAQVEKKAREGKKRKKKKK